MGYRFIKRFFLYLGRLKRRSKTARNFLEHFLSVLDTHMCQAYATLLKTSQDAVALQFV